MPNAHRIASAMGIKLHGRRDNGLHPRSDELPARHTWSRQAIFDIALAGERNGLPEHVYDVLGLMMSSDRNATQLFGDAIRGVSKWALRNRITTEEVTFLRQSFDDMDLRVIRQAVIHHGIDQKAAQIAFLVADHMEGAICAIRQ
jgi:hypothetical protein